MNLLITDTEALAWLRVRGAEADAFLQGQLSNDIRTLSDAQAQLSSYNNPKGRMLAALHLVRSGEEIWIELPRSIAEPTLKRLKMFVMRSKLTIDAADDLDALAFIGADAAGMLPFFGLPLPEAPLQCLRSEQGLVVVRRLGTLPRYTVVGARDEIARLRAMVPEAMREPEGLLWRHADIEAGVPTVLPETREHFVPQMVNLDLLGGISFDKGCYPGQEIVARLHYLGQLKRRLFVAEIDGAAPAPGSEVHADDPQLSGQAVGEIVDAVPVRGGALATLVLQLSHRDAALRVGAASLRLRSGPAA